MATVKHVQLLRGTTQENDKYTGLQGELTVDYIKESWDDGETPRVKDIRIHDNTTPGGVRVLTMVNLKDVFAEESHSYVDKHGNRIGGLLDGAISYEALDPETLPTIDTALDTTSTNAVTNSAVALAIKELTSGKAEAKHSHSLTLVDGVVTGDVDGILPIALTADYNDLLNTPKVIDSVLEGSDALVKSTGIFNALAEKAEVKHTHSLDDITDFAEKTVTVTTTYDPNDATKAMTGVAVTSALESYESSIKNFAEERYVNADGDTIFGDIVFKTKPTYVNEGVSVEFATLNDVQSLCGDVLPDQMNHTGEVLTTDGSTASWDKVQSLLTEVERDALHSGVTAQVVSEVNDHIADEDIHVTAEQKAEWSAKQNALSDAQMDAVNSGITSDNVSALKDAVETLDAHVADETIHVTSEDKAKWNAKQDALTAKQLAALDSGITEDSVILLNARVDALETNDETYNAKVDEFITEDNKKALEWVKSNNTAIQTPSRIDTALDNIEELKSKVDEVRKAIQQSTGFMYKKVSGDSSQYFSVNTVADLQDISVADLVDGYTYYVKDTGAFYAYINGEWTMLSSGEVSHVLEIDADAQAETTVKGADVPTVGAVKKYVGDAVDNAVNEINETIEALDGRVESVEDDLATAKSDIEDLQARVDVAEDNIDALSSKDAELEGSIEDVSDRVGDVEWVNDAFTLAKDEDGAIESVSVLMGKDEDGSPIYSAIATKTDLDNFDALSEDDKATLAKLNPAIKKGLLDITIDHNEEFDYDSVSVFIDGSLVVEDGEAKKLISTDEDGNKVYSEFATKADIDLIMGGDADHDGLTKQIDDLRTTIDEQVGATDLLKDIFLGSEKEDSDGDMYNLDNWEGGLADTIKANENAISSIQGDVTTLQSSMSTANTNISNLTEQVEDAQDNITRLGSQVAAFQGSLNTTNGNVTNLTSRVDDAEDDIVTLKSSMTTANTNITNLQQAIADLVIPDEVDLQPIYDRLDALEKKFDDLEALLKKFVEDNSDPKTEEEPPAP